MENKGQITFSDNRSIGDFTLKIEKWLQNQKQIQKDRCITHC